MPQKCDLTSRKKIAQCCRYQANDANNGQLLSYAGMLSW